MRCQQVTTIDPRLLSPTLQYKTSQPSVAQILLSFDVGDKICSTQQVREIVYSKEIQRQRLALVQ